MILAVDVCYENLSALAAGLLFEHWDDKQEQCLYTSVCEDVEEYIPGQFYRRELPCILKLIEQHHIRPDIIIIDGFVYLDGIAQPGLGRHLYDALHCKVAVIGVAKNPLKEIPADCEITRGRSTRPLYVTSIGIELDKAKRLVKSMHGTHRIPTLLKKVDLQSRQMKD